MVPRFLRPHPGVGLFTSHTYLDVAATGAGLQTLHRPLFGVYDLKVAKADPAQAHRAPPPPLFRKKIKDVFLKISTHKLYCNQHAMFTICTLFSTLNTKA